MVGVDYPAARQAITLAMKAEDRMFACVDDFPALLKMGPVVSIDIFEKRVYILNWRER